MEEIGRIYAEFFGADTVVAPEYMLMFAVLAWIFYKLRRIDSPFWSWAFPRSMWFSRSSFVDLVLFVSNKLLDISGLTGRLIITPIVAAFVAGLINNESGGLINLSPVALAAAFFIVYDFATYWIHRAHHQMPFLWPLHAVHHSASVMTPLTTYRQHPLGVILLGALYSIFLGAAFGVLIGTMDNSFTAAEIAGANAFTVVANVLVSHFHHSHIWISFGPFWERIFISPAQHQVHHSVETRHHNKNYGGFLAFWDWMFGTLYLTRPDETVTFGLDGPSEEPLMTQRLGPMLWQPVKRVARLGR